MTKIHLIMIVNTDYTMIKKHCGNILSHNVSYTVLNAMI